MNNDAKVVLVFPKISPKHMEELKQYIILPMSLLTIAAPLEKAGFAVTIIDQRLDIDWPARLEAELKSGAVAAVGISVMTGYPIKGALEAAAVVRTIAPSVKIVWGGVHATLLAEQTAQSELVDVVVEGEGEATFTDLVRVLASGGNTASVPGIIYQEGGRIKRTPARDPIDLNDLPSPAYHLVDVDSYLHSPWQTEAKRPIALLTSRGCPWRCGYCYNLVFNQRRWRCWSADRVVSEIERLIGEYRADSFFLLDDNFFVKKQRVLDVCRMLLQKNISVKMVNANCRVDTLHGYTDEELGLLRECGFESLFVGLESGSPRVLERIAKDISLEQAITVNRRLRKIGIIPIYSFMAGFPDETISDIKLTLELMAHLRRDNSDAVINPVNIFSPFPGTPLFTEALTAGVPMPADLQGWIDLDYQYLNYSSSMPARESAFLQSVHILSNYIDPKTSGNGSFLRKAAKRSYSRLLNWRVRHNFYRFMPELSLARRRSRRRLAARRLGAD